MSLLLDRKPSDAITSASENISQMREHLLRAAAILFHNSTDDEAMKYFRTLSDRWTQVAVKLNSIVFENAHGAAFLRAVG